MPVSSEKNLAFLLESDYSPTILKFSLPLTIKKLILTDLVILPIIPGIIKKIRTQKTLNKSK